MWTSSPCQGPHDGMTMVNRNGEEVEMSRHRKQSTVWLYKAWDSQGSDDQRKGKY